MKCQIVRILFMIFLCLIAGCKAMYNDNRQIPNISKFAINNPTNEVFLNLHVTNNPPDKVTVKIEGTNSTPTIEMRVKVDAQEPEEITVPLKLAVTGSNEFPVKVSMTLSNALPLIIPVTLSTDLVKEIAVPVKVKVETSGDPSAKIPSEITLKLDDNLKALLKQLSDHSSNEHPKMEPAFPDGTWFRRHEWLSDFVVLLLIVVCFGIGGGLLRKAVDRDTEWWPNIIFGMTAALLVPIVLYSRERKIFELGIKDPLLLLILVSASLAAGLIGAVFVQWFYRTVTKMLHTKK